MADIKDINERFIIAVETLVKSRATKDKSTLSNSLGIKQNKLSEILGKRMNTSLELISDLSELYNINLDWLIYGRGEIKKEEESNFVNEPSLNYNADIDQKLINQMCNYVGVKDKKQLIIFFRRINEKRTKFNPDKLEMRIERLELLVGQMTLNNIEIKKHKTTI